MRFLRFFAVTALIAAALTLRAETPDASATILNRAKQQAKTEHKNLLLVFSASWCGPCKLYERYLEDPTMKAINEKAFVIARFDVGEHANDPIHHNTPGAEQLRSQLGAAAEPGFPFIIMANEDGKPIVNSYINGDKASNIGEPEAPNEIIWYVEMLKRAAPRLSDADREAQRTWLTAHASHH